MKKVAVLGSTGTIGRLSLEVIDRFSDRLSVFAIAANRNIELLGRQIKEYKPSVSVVLDEGQCRGLKGAVDSKLECGPQALVNLASHGEVDIVMVAMTGTAAVDAVMAALHAGKRVALASKEILVSFGEHVCEAVRQGKGELLPVDSEHNALHQCLDGRDIATVKRLILTASGGPFRDKDYSGVTPREVLDHPTWNMGHRITVDSATLMNKGFEVIEAHYLFGIPPDRIEVVVHPQSIVHSMVEFVDSSVLAHMALPDMRLPIAYAMLYPHRAPSVVDNLDVIQVGSLDFEKPDFERFPCLELAYEALRRGGTAPAVLQAADYEAVQLFLAEKVEFERIPVLIAGALENVEHVSHPHMDQIRTAERLAGRYVNQGV